MEVQRGHNGLFDYCTFGVEAANDAQTVRVNTACAKNHSQKCLSKLILWCRNVYNYIASDVSGNNLVYKLTTSSCNRC